MEKNVCAVEVQTPSAAWQNDEEALALLQDGTVKDTFSLVSVLQLHPPKPRAGATILQYTYRPDVGMEKQSTSESVQLAAHRMLAQRYGRDFPYLSEAIQYAEEHSPRLDPHTAKRYWAINAHANLARTRHFYAAADDLNVSEWDGDLVQNCNVHGQLGARFVLTHQLHRSTVRRCPAAMMLRLRNLRLRLKSSLADRSTGLHCKSTAQRHLAFLAWLFLLRHWRNYVNTGMAKTTLCVE